MIKTGEVIELAHVLNDKMPFFGTRRFDVHVKRTFLNQPANRAAPTRSRWYPRSARWAPSSTASPTRAIEDSLYNCFKISETSHAVRLHQARHPPAGTVFARGVLIDVAAFKGVEMLPDTYEITVEDLEGALKKQGTELQAGDAILINTGWNKLWARTTPARSSRARASASRRRSGWSARTRCCSDPTTGRWRWRPIPTR